MKSQQINCFLSNKKSPQLIYFDIINKGIFGNRKKLSNLELFAKSTFRYLQNCLNSTYCLSMQSTFYNLAAKNFVNLKAKNYVQNLRPKDILHLENLFKQNQCQRKLMKKKLFQFNEIEFKKVASQVQFLGYDKDYSMIFGIYGPKIDKSNKEYLIFTLNRIIEESFYSKTKYCGEAKGYKKYSTQGITLVFFNNCALRKAHNFRFVSNRQIIDPLKIDDFKNQVIKQLELRSVNKISKIYLVFPSLLTKSWNFFTSFGVQNGFYENYFLHIESIYDLFSNLGPLFEVHKIESSVLDFDMSKNNKNWRTLFSNYQKAHSFNQFKSYEKMCELSSSDNLENFSRYIFKTTLNEYPLDFQNKLPAILSILIKYLVDRCVNFPGIFRKVADQRQLVRFQNFLNDWESSNNIDQNQSADLYHLADEFPKFQVQTLTSFYKKVFTELEKPIFSFQQAENIVKLSLKQIQFCLLKDEKSHRISFTLKQDKKLTQNIIINSNVNHIKNKVWQKVAFFQSLSKQNKINQSILNLEKMQSTEIADKLIVKTSLDGLSVKNQKISFKKVQNGKKLKVSEETSPKESFYLKISSMKNQNPLAYQTFKSTIMLLNRIKQNQKLNLMSSRNLAICFNPCFFKIPQSYLKDFTIQQQCEMNNKLVIFIEKIIENPRGFFND